jgi:hypothetical protein
MTQQSIGVIRPGDQSKPDPYTIVIISNPALERPWRSGAFVADPITANKAVFDACVSYIDQCLFGSLLGEAEQFLNDPSIAVKLRVVSLWVTGLVSNDANALVAEDADDVSHILVARRSRFVTFLSRFNLQADVAYAVSQSPTHKRASAWYTSDDDASGGVPFAIDGMAFVHRHRCLIPGTVAIHSTANSLTAIHEFGHAASSYTNGDVTDLYVDSAPALNCRNGRPIPSDFADYDGTVFSSDTARDSLGYPSGWISYHCKLIDLAHPSVMDNYPLGTPPEASQHDAITRKFLLERIRSKTMR